MKSKLAAFFTAWMLAFAPATSFAQSNDPEGEIVWERGDIEVMAVQGLVGLGLGVGLGVGTAVLTFTDDCAESICLGAILATYGAIVLGTTIGVQAVGAAYDGDGNLAATIGGTILLGVVGAVIGYQLTSSKEIRETAGVQPPIGAPIGFRFEF